MVSLQKILKKGKALFLAYDQGLEHGPAEFTDKNLNPLYIIDIAQKGKFTGMIFQKGIAEKYHAEIKKSGIPLIIKLNGKTNLVKGEPLSRQLCSVKEAVSLGAKAVGYTIYLGSEHESIMMQEFEKIEEESHKKNIPVILWAYPRGKNVKRKNKAELMKYAARVGLELGADIIKLQYHGTEKDLAEAVCDAGRTKIVVSGGAKKNEKEFLKEAREVMNSGCIGLAVGRNIWQHPQPLQVAEKLRKVVWGR
jgi:class I fructose-bisphosphate aldolase